MPGIKPHKVKVKEYSWKDFSEADEEDFHIFTNQDERLIDYVPGLDDDKELADNMYNFGEEENLPDSDRETQCRKVGKSYKSCFNR